jgi:hypothetical protein
MPRPSSPLAPRSVRRATGWRLPGSVLAAALLAAAAARAGVLTPDATQPPITYPIQPPGSPIVNGCGNCHGIETVQAGYESLQWNLWAGSMMANAARDPIFWAAVDVANHDLPGAGDFCLRCHVPTGWYEGRSEPPGGTTDGCGLVGPIDTPNTDFEGVSCHLCHRAEVNQAPPPGQQAAYHENGKLWLDDTDCGGQGEPCRHGPYDYPPGGPPQPPHPWAYSEYHAQAEICGACHNVTNPVRTLIDETGADTGVPYPIERTYREWSLSSYGAPGPNERPCQGCHMPDAEGPGAAYACIFGQTDRAGDLPMHRFVGGNRWVPEVLRNEYPNLDRDQQYLDTVAWAGEQLQRAATVALSAPPEAQPGQPFEVAVRVTNLAGHKLPTGYTEGRRMWIRLRALDADGVVVWQSGAWDPATGTLAEDPQLKVYRSEPGIWNRNGTGECDAADENGRPLFRFVLNDCIRIDNRIPPLGFAGGHDPETRPVGYVYPPVSPGVDQLVHWDDTTYQVTVPPLAVSPVTLEAGLLYQTASKESVEFLRDEAVANDFPPDCIQRASGVPMISSRGQYLYDLWTQYGRAAPFVMAADAKLVVVGRIFSGDFETGDTSQWSVAIP